MAKTIKEIHSNIKELLNEAEKLIEPEHEFKVGDWVEYCGSTECFEGVVFQIKKICSETKFVVENNWHIPLDNLKPAQPPKPKIECSVGWKPDIGQEYWYISDCGNVCSTYWTDHIVDIYRQRSNNIFKTEEEAELYLKIFNRIHELNEEQGWVADFNAGVVNYYITWSYDDEVCYYDNTRSYHIQGATYMSKETYNTIRKEFTDEELEIWVRR